MHWCKSNMRFVKYRKSEPRRPRLGYLADMKDRSRTYASDRERLAAALAELDGRGYLLMPAAWDVCCAGCGWTELARQVGVTEDFPDDLRTVWWHEQADSQAFFGDASAFLQTDEFWDRLPEDDEEAQTWMEEHVEEATADSIAARVGVYNNLVDSLYLHWMGDRDEIAAALRATGLRVVTPTSPDMCFEVLPSRAHFHASAIGGEVLVRTTNGELHLTAAEARKLAKQVNAAAREAVAQGQLFGT